VCVYAYVMVLRYSHLSLVEFTCSGDAGDLNPLPSKRLCMSSVLARRIL
jgi:hypothetical protein